jgi:processive 1,2-diacylglycerol beta-glucosyltransferase
VSGKRSNPGCTAERVLIISGSVGAGHDGAAAELAERLRAAGVDADVRDHLDALPPPVRTILRRGYTAANHYRPAFMEWLFTSAEHARWMRLLLDWVCWLGRRRVRRWSRGATLVVSTFPFASQTLGQLRRSGRLTVPTVTYLTDPAPHRLWVHPAVDHHLTVTEATALAGARDYHVPMRAVGGLVRTAFGQPRTEARRTRVRAALGLPATGPVVLIMAGSEGMGDISSTVDVLRRADPVHTIVLCGRNERLRRDLDGHPRVLALGWRKDVADLMAAADVLVHNAGGLSLTEALTAGLPAVTFRPIPGHGRYNASVLEQAGLVPWPRDDQSLVREVLAQCADRDRPVLGALPNRVACRFVLSLLTPPPVPAARTAPEQQSTAIA